MKLKLERCLISVIKKIRIKINVLDFAFKILLLFKVDFKQVIENLQLEIPNASFLIFLRVSKIEKNLVSTNATLLYFASIIMSAHGLMLFLFTAFIPAS